MSSPNREEPAIVVAKAYDFVLWLLPKVEKFSRSYRFTVGDRLAKHGLNLLLVLVQSAYSSNKVDWLQEASEEVNGIRYLLRLAKDLKLMSGDSYGFAAERLDEIGRMVGGWHKAAMRRS